MRWGGVECLQNFGRKTWREISRRWECSIKTDGKCGGVALTGVMWLGIVPRPVYFEQGICLSGTMRGVGFIDNWATISFSVRSLFIRVTVYKHANNTVMPGLTAANSKNSFVVNSWGTQLELASRDKWSASQRRILRISRVWYITSVWCLV
jgi:hypothetical protein